MADAPPKPPSQPSALRYIDSHIHLDADQFADDLDRVIGDAVRVGVTDFINIGYEPARWRSTRALCERYRCIHPVYGMHPGSVEQWTAETARELERLLDDHRPLAIGEIGIDLIRGETNLDRQQAVFEAQLDLAVCYNLPVVIHMRAAETEVIELLSRRSSCPPVLFHSFEGSSELTDFANEIGAYVGVGGLATRAKSGAVRLELARIDLSRIVLETDAPYLIPAKRRGTRNVPANLPVIAEMLANLRQIDLETVAGMTNDNTQRFFRLNRGSAS